MEPYTCYDSFRVSDQLGQLLGYFDNDGVTELVIHTGQPISVRINGEYRAVTEGTVSKPQLAHLMLGTPLDALTPEDERNSESRILELGGRPIHALLIKRGKEIALTLATSAPQPAPVVYSPQITKPAAIRAQTSPTIPPAKPAAPPTPTPPPPPTPPPVPIPPPRAATPAPPATPAPRPRTPTPASDVRAPGPAPTAPRTHSATDSPVQIHAKVPADVLADLPGGSPNLSLDLDPEDNESTSFQNIPLAPNKKAPERRISRAVSVSGVEGEPELDSGLPRDVSTKSDIDRVESTDPGAWVPELEPVLPRSATQDQSAFEPPGFAIRTPAPVAIPPAPVAPPIPAPPPAQIPPPAISPPSAFAPPVVAPRIEAPVVAAEVPQLVDEPGTIVPAFVNLVKAARAANASDLHIAANRPVLIRTMAELKPLEPKPLTAAEVEGLLLPLLGPRRRRQLEERGYVDLAVQVPGAGRLRANISRIQGGLKGAFRLALPRPFTLDELALPKELAKVVSHHQGLVVIAGPSGHGKTTTLGALVDLINSTRAHHILTVEDPVEIEHPRKAAVVSMREVGRHTLSFAAALKASLREDPDVIVIGELRDRETVEIAMTAAETGHLVMATMSTPSAAKTIDRLIDMFPPDDQSQVRASLAGALRAIVAQRLVPTKDGKVAPAIELLTGVLPLAVLIRDNKLFQLPNLMQRGRSLGMIRLDESLIDLVKRGKISEETALANADSKKEMTIALRGPASTSIPKVTK